MQVDYNSGDKKRDAPRAFLRVGCEKGADRRILADGFIVEKQDVLDSAQKTSGCGGSTAQRRREAQASRRRFFMEDYLA